MKSLSAIKFYFQRVYRLTLSPKKQQDVVWNDLIKLHKEANWKSGVFEKDKYIETTFTFKKGKYGTFYYMIYDGFFHCKVKILETFPLELTTDLFVLAAHFNNLLNEGVVIVNTESQYVEFYLKKDLLINLLYSGELYNQLIKHYDISKDIYAAYQRLIIEQEAPAIIIADLLREKEEDKKSK
jgi:hypothetical protein